MTISTSASLTELVQSEVIQSRLIDTAYENVVIMPFVRVGDNVTGGGRSPTASFPQIELDAVDVLTTEGTTTFTAVELQSTEIAVITAGTVGMFRDFTQFGLDTNILGQAEVERFVVEDGSRLIASNIDNDLAALFTSYTASVSHTGLDFTLGYFLEAVGNVDATNAHGQKVCVLDNQQLIDFRLDLSSSGAAFLGQAGRTNLLDRLSDNSGGGFNFADIAIVSSNQTDTANTNADVVGAMFVDGVSAPGAASLGMVWVRTPTADSLPVLNAITRQYLVYASYGVGLISQYGTSIITDA